MKNFFIYLFFFLFTLQAQENNSISQDKIDAVEIHTELDQPLKKGMKLNADGAMVIGVADDPLLKDSPTIFDLFRKIPRLIVTSDQEVSLIGKSTPPAFLLNDRLINSDLLVGIPLEDIDQIEILESPTPKYISIAKSDLVIRIVTKNKKIRNQWFLTPSVLVGGLQQFQGNFSLNAGINIDRWVLRGGYSYQPSWMQNQDQSIYDYSPALLATISKIINEDKQKTSQWNRHSTSLELEYQLHPSHTLSLSYSFFFSAKQQIRQEKKQYQYLNLEKPFSITPFLSSDFSSYNYSHRIELAYKWQIDDQGQSLQTSLFYYQNPSFRKYNNWQDPLFQFVLNRFTTNKTIKPII